MRPNTSFLSIPEIVVSLIISLLLVLFSLTGTFKGVSAVAQTITGGIQSDSFNFFQGFNENLQFLQSIGDVKTERDRLAKENLDLRSENTQLKEQLADLRILQEQLKFDLPHDLLAARVILYDETQTGELVINKGEDQGVKIGDAVVYKDFAVGEITDVFSGSARVRLLNSPDSLVPVKTINQGTKGLVKGDLALGLVLNEVLTEDVLKQGDRVITTGINSNFPAGLNVGKVSEIVSVKSELTKSAQIDSEIEFHSLSELFVIIK